MTDFLYFEDFQPGQFYELGEVSVTEDAILEFASEFDPQPFHLDPHAAAQSMLGGLSASGWHTACLGMRLFYDGLIKNSSCQGSPGVDELAWKAPVMPGDTLRGRVEILAVRALKSRPDMGLVTVAVTLENQENVLVARYENPVLFGKKTGDA